MSRINKYLTDYGLLGLAEIVSNKCCGFPKVMVAYPPKLGHAVRLRLNTSDRVVFRWVIIDEEYSFGLPSSANVIVDAGGYVGLTPIFYAKTFPKARIFTIEAERSNFELYDPIPTSPLSMRPCGAVKGIFLSAIRSLELLVTGDSR